MKRKAFIVLIFILSFATSFSLEEYQKIILKGVNIEREKNNLKPLKIDNHLNKIAIVKAKDMAREKKMSHTSKKFGVTFNLIKKEGIVTTQLCSLQKIKNQLKLGEFA